MTLPPYTWTREGEARQPASSPKPCWLALSEEMLAHHDIAIAILQSVFGNAGR